jgi:ribosomal protein S18 acetylase RimI-like enzyme
MAVDPEYRGRRLYFDLRSFVYPHFPEPEVYLDTTTQIGNLWTIRNLIRTQKTLESIRFCFYRRKPGGPARPHTKGSQGGRLALGLREMRWETEFFGRRFGKLEIGAEGLHVVEPHALDQALKKTLSSGDQSGFDVIEVQLDMSWLHHMHRFESEGFRLVDTKLRFLTHVAKGGLGDLPARVGEIGFASADTKEEILGLTHSAFTDNPAFHSRFKNERFFTKADTRRYYEAWIENYLGDPDTLFAVTRDEGRVVGYMIYTKTGEHEGRPLYKAALAAVAPEYRGRNLYFAMGAFVYNHLPEGGAFLDMSTQLSNVSTIRNLFKARRNLDSVQLVFYRPREDGLAANPI